ncbi:MAG: type II secretion system protein [bacterium]
MRNSGMGFISIILSLLVIAILALTLTKKSGLHHTESTDARIERAQEVECAIKLKALNKQIEVYKMGHEEYPPSLAEVTDNAECPVSHVELKYDGNSGKAWCPVHK